MNFGLLLKNRNAGELGIRLANMHSQSLNTDFISGTRIDGKYLCEKCLEVNMVLYSETVEALRKMDHMISKITDTSVRFVELCVWRGISLSKKEVLYGNPALDLGMVVYTLSDVSAAEEFLRCYLDNGGIRITIVEMFSGILYAKLYKALEEGNESMWNKLASNDCNAVINGGPINHIEIAPGLLGRLGLPALHRDD